MASKNSTLAARAAEPATVDEGPAADTGGHPPEAADAEVVLRLGDLISDDRGEIVFFNDSGVRSLGIVADSGVVDEGVTKSHRTAAGADVSGYHFVTFANGLTLYVEAGIEVMVLGGPAV